MCGPACGISASRSTSGTTRTTGALHRYNLGTGQFERRERRRLHGPEPSRARAVAVAVVAPPNPAILLPIATRIATERIELPDPDVSPAGDVAVNLGMWLAVEPAGPYTAQAAFNDAVWADTDGDVGVDQLRSRRRQRSASPATDTAHRSPTWKSPRRSVRPRLRRPYRHRSSPMTIRRRGGSRGGCRTARSGHWRTSSRRRRTSSTCSRSRPSASAAELPGDPLADRTAAAPTRSSIWPTDRSPGNRYEGPWAWIAATARPARSRTTAATELIPAANSS